jgi:S1-C subfamily serine protease
MGNAQAFKTDKIGFQVISVSPQSPGEDAGLKVHDDFILTMNGQALPFMEAEKIMSTVKVISCSFW